MADYGTMVRCIKEKRVKSIEREFNLYFESKVDKSLLNIAEEEIHKYGKLKLRLDSFKIVKEGVELEKYLAVFIAENDYKRDIYLNFIQYFLFTSKINYFQAFSLFLFSSNSNYNIELFKKYLSKYKGDIVRVFINYIGISSPLLYSLTSILTKTAIDMLEGYLEDKEELTKYEIFKDILFDSWTDIINDFKNQIESSLYGYAFDDWLKAQDAR